MKVLHALINSFRNANPPADAIGNAGLAPGITLEQYEALVPNQTVREGATEVIYAVPTTFVKWRVDTLFTKEPDTIEWIRGFQAGEVLVDVGANVGMYTVWAAKTRGVRVYAFEPESQNYALLYKNIVLNGLHQQVIAFCAALSDEIGYSLLHLRMFEIGRSSHSFGENVGPHLEPRKAGISQGCIATTLDHLVASGVLPAPDHIKIDVDGLEHKVLAGCRNVLADPKVKSVLIEINTNLKEHRALIADLEKLGFSYSRDQVKRSIRTEGAFAGVANHVFRR